jgi:predicted nuclease of predicted toxin-antitoxin system
MRFLFDQNISHRILAILPEQFSDSTSVKKEGLINSTDREMGIFQKE